MTLLSTSGAASASVPESRVCTRTGLRLVASAGATATRIQRVSFGPMNPLQRPVEGGRMTWSRFDVPGHRTIYAGSSRQAAYAEALAALRSSPSLMETRLSDVFSDEQITAAPNRTFREAVEKEWQDQHFGMTPQKLARAWRDARREYQLTLPKDGWFVDGEAIETVTVVRNELGEQLSVIDPSITDFTRAHLLGENREITTMVSHWIHPLVLDDGSLPHGIKYGSKYGSNRYCYAIWLRALDDGKDLASEPTSAADGRQIEDRHHNPALDEAAKLFKIDPQ